MLAKIKTITNLGSVVISVVLVTLQVIDLFKHENNNPASPWASPRVVHVLKAEILSTLFW